MIGVDGWATRPVVGRLSWRAYPLLGAVVLAGYYLLPGGLPRDIAYSAVGLSSVVAIGAGIRRNRPTHPVAWWLMAAGELSWVVGDSLASWSEEVRHTAGHPPAVDAFYLCAYPLLAGGIGLLVRGRRSAADRGGLIDTAIITVGLGLLSWVVLAAPTYTDSGLSDGTRLLGVAYPAADVLLVALLARLLAGPGARTRAFGLLAGAIALLLVADTAYAVLQRAWGYSGDSLDVIWLGSYVLWGTAALHPTMRGLTLTDPAPSAPLTKRRLAALLLAVLIAPGALAVELAAGVSPDGWTIVAGSVALFGLVVARMNLSIRQLLAGTAHQQRLQHDLAFQAAHDSLTQLPNRSQILGLTGSALHRAQRSGAAIAVLLLDLDQFKAVNDDLGHAIGDEVLRTVARVIEDIVRAGDTVGRLAGDEFAIVVEPVESEEALVGLADRLIEAVSRPLFIDGHRIVVGASIGISVSRDAGTDPGLLMREAGAAVQRAKAAGRGQAEVFDDVLRREIRERTELEAAIGVGLAEGQFVLHYQPVVDLRTGRTRAHEALIRWHRPGYGLVGPDQFIPTAEKSGLICEIGRWVLAEASRQLVAWTDAPEQIMAVNISGRHLTSPHILGDIKAALAGSGLAPGRLIVEITETVLVDDPVAVHHLNAIRKLGALVSIDDFGTGYTSIGQLQNLPVDTLKIDKSFIDSDKPGARELVELMVNAAHAFGLRVVAEGVERADQLLALRQIGCDFVQGYLLARPLTADAAGLRLAAAAAAAAAATGT